MKRLAAVILLLIVFIAVLPYLLASPVGKSWVERKLGQRLHGEVTVQRLQFSWLGPQSFEGVVFANADIKGSIQQIRSNVPFWRIQSIGDAFFLQEGRVEVQGHPDYAVEHLNAEVKGHTLVAKAQTPLGGSLSVQGQIFSSAALDITVQAQNIPTPFLDRRLVPFVGDFVSLQGSIVLQNKEGPITIKATTPTFHATLNGLLTHNLLTLKEPLRAVWANLPQIDLAQGTSLQMQDPVLLTVFPEGASIPLQPFRLAGLAIGRAELNLGRFTVQGGASIGSFLKLFKGAKTGSSVPFWLTAADFQIHEGQIELGRVDMLIDRSIHVCLWGRINAVKDRLHLILGLPADTLNTYFSVPNLSRNYVLQVPVKGSLREPEFMTGPALAKIAALSTPALPGKAGKTFGGLVNAITQAKEDEAPPPKRPFPWEK